MRLPIGIAFLLTALHAEPPTRIVEIRSYHLKPGVREAFHARFVRESLPLLQRSKIDVVAYGPSLADADSYYLIRSYPDLETRQKSEDAFYLGDQWLKGPREAVLAAIETYNTIVIRLDDATLRGLRGAQKENAMQPQAASASDLTRLLELNQDYIQSVQTSDVQRFQQILAEDFLCSLPDGSLLDRDHFLEITARPVTISDLEAHDVNVRLMGDFAIIHARTTFKLADGRAGSGRYTDVWARKNGTWLAVSAHVTRL